MAEVPTDPALNLPGYEILRELGRGGVSTVYLARHRLLERQVAVKVISPALAVEEGFNKRFIREGQTIAQLGHPGIVTVYDVAVVNHRPCITMEYLPGGSLKDRMKDAIPPDEAVRLLKSIARSLDFAHQCGIFHRDVKPENILFRENGDPVLTDFGIAKSESQETALTSVGVVVGTPRYISPEQAQGSGCDARSDVYALGVIFYEMLAGRPPYDVKGSMSLLYAHINDPIPSLPEGLEAYQGIVDDLLAKEPDQRVPDCGTLVERLEALESSSGDPVVVDIGAKATAAASERARQRPVARPGFVWAGLSTVVLALFLWFTGDLSLPDVEEGVNLETSVKRLLAPGSSLDGAQTVSRDDKSAQSLETAQPAEEPDSDPVSLFRRARALHTGSGIERDVPAAMGLYERSASAGHALSQYYLGVAYGNGEGVQRDEAQALHWLSRAAGAGIRGAQYNLILARVFGPGRDPEKAAELAIELAKKEYAPVYRILGWMYNTGTGVDSSFTQSVRWNMKTMVGDVTGKSGAPGLVVHRWEARMNRELDKIWDSGPRDVK